MRECLREMGVEEACTFLDQLPSLWRTPSLAARQPCDQPIPSPRNRERSGEQRNAATLQWRGWAGRLQAGRERRGGPPAWRDTSVPANPYLSDFPVGWRIPLAIVVPTPLPILLASAQGTDAAAREPFRSTRCHSQVRGRELTNRRPLIYTEAIQLPAMRPTPIQLPAHEHNSGREPLPTHPDQALWPGPSASA
jgi:hypothetical protein